MLSLRQPELAEALEEVGQYGVCKIAGALTPDARHELRMALEALDFQRAPQWVGEVRQDFDLLAIKPGLGRADTALAPLLALAESYAALLRAKAPSLDEPRWRTSCPRISMRNDTARGPQGFRPIGTAGGSSSSSPSSLWAAPPNSASSATAGARR